MRTNDDLIKIRVHMYAIADLDWERIEQDPYWLLVAENYDLTDNEQRQAALFRYLTDHIAREQLFANRPVYGTNGPSDLFITEMEDVSHGISNTRNQDSNVRDPEASLRGENPRGL